MRNIISEENLKIPEGVTVSIKARKVIVQGPRGKLSKDIGHIDMGFSKVGRDTIRFTVHHGSRKHKACLRTVKSLIENMIIGVTKGFQYKMRYVYAHFPINVNVDNGKVEIRNFLGEKLVRRVPIKEGVDVSISSAQKDELILEGNSVESVSQCAADIQQICRVRNKDIRKFLDGIYVSSRGNIVQED